MYRFLIPLFSALIIVCARGEDQPNASSESATTSWIWKSNSPGETEKVFFRREFQLPPDVTSAVVTVTCDNRHRLLVNGKELGMGGEWGSPRSYDVLPVLKPGGRNVIAVEGRNEGGDAGMALRFRATLKSGKKLHVVSDANWLCSNEAPDGWQNPGFQASTWSKAVVIAKMGEGPWGDVMKAEAVEPSAVVDKTSDYQVASGFKLEQVYRVPSDQGSWVAMTVDAKGRLICSDQYGKIYRVTPAANADGKTQVEPMNISLQGAHGLLWHEGVLWVSVNEGPGPSGVWRVTDSNGDGDPDKPELVKEFNGRGEHGPHGLVASPDGKCIYVTSGNFTDLPEMERSLTSRSWGEDQLLPRRPDANGHARDRMAPGGWTARFTPDGKNWEVFAIGFRNDYDIAFNDAGDLFGYDSDMEWDLGMPWYRPTRICHIAPGSEFGWRNGSGPWPTYYEDSMKPLLEIGPGSPTGMASGKGAKFPEKYQRSIFALDWTFGTMYAIHLTPDGPGYRAEREEFISGKGLPFTDAVVGKDGTLYFLTGGRRTDSAMWRVSYTGKESVAPVTYRTKPLGLMDAAAANASLGSENRLTRFNSRVALEKAGPQAFVPVLGNASSTPWQVINASLGLARIGSDTNRPQILTALDRLDWAKLDQQQKLNWLRAAGLVFARYGQPDEAARAKVLAKIDSSFPANNDMMNRELCRILSYLQAPGIVSRTLTLMDSAGPTPAPDWLELAKRNANYGKTVEEMIANLPPAQVIHYIYCLRVVKGPWQEDERRRFFGWFSKLLKKKGGASYAGFIVDLRKETLATCTPQEREWIGQLKDDAPQSALANLPEVKGPGRDWTIEEVVKLADSGLAGRNKENGRKMFQASLCIACHRFGGDGGNAGPDLSAVGGRFGIRDLAEAILDPSKVVSSQYAFDLIAKKSGGEIMGKIIEEKDEKWIIATNPFDLTQTTEIEHNDIKSSNASPVSPMPPGLINRLNPDELKDLLAYLLAK